MPGLVLEYVCRWDIRGSKHNRTNLKRIAVEFTQVIFNTFVIRFPKIELTTNYTRRGTLTYPEQKCS